MIYAQQQVSNNSDINNNSIVQKIDSDIKNALALLDGVEKENTNKTIKEMKNLLIEYILANMDGDHSEAAAILSQIGKLTQTYEQHMKEGEELGKKLKAMEENPGQHLSKDLTFLQSVIGALQGDVKSFGSMDNLSQFLQGN